MNKIKVVVLKHYPNWRIEDAEVGYIKYPEKMRVGDLLEKINHSWHFRKYKDEDKNVENQFKVELLSAYYHDVLGYIDWNIDVDSLYVKRIKELFDNDFIVVESYDPCGGGVDDVLLLYILGKIQEFFLDLLWRLILRYIITFKKAKMLLEEETGNDFNYIKSIIVLQTTWKVGFISKGNFKFKKRIEKSIMKKLGYKKQNNMWISKDSI